MSDPETHGRLRQNKDQSILNRISCREALSVGRKAADGEGFWIFGATGYGGGSHDPAPSAGSFRTRERGLASTACFMLASEMWV